MEPQDLLTYITDNLVSALDSKVITYGDKDRVITAEQERLLWDIPEDSYPYVSVCGPWLKVEERRRNKSAKSVIGYSVELRDNTLSDTLRPKQDRLNAPPLTRVMLPVLRQIVQMVMAEPTRGGAAMLTSFTDLGYFHSGIDNAPEIVWYVDFEIDLFVDVETLLFQGA